ncbi:hypothetical protein ACHAWX_004961 [Stephanocyclus meneghinianus]
MSSQHQLRSAPTMTLLMVVLAACILSVHSFTPMTHTRSASRVLHANKAPDNVLEGDGVMRYEEPTSRREVMSRLLGASVAGLFSGSLASNVPSANAEVAKVAVSTSPQLTQAPPKVAPKLENPGDIKNCSDFSSYKDAKAWFDKYYDLYGDVALLDKNKNMIPCESLPGAPSTKEWK